MAHYNLNFVFPSYFSLQCTNIQAVVVLDEYRTLTIFITGRIRERTAIILIISKTGQVAIQSKIKANI